MDRRFLLQRVVVAIGVSALGAGAATARTIDDAADAWPQFRGPRACGVADGIAAATRFDLETGEHLRFRVEVPGMAHSSPIVWGQRVYVQTAEAEADATLKVGLYGAGDSVTDEGEQAFSLLCYDRKDGELLWEQLSWQGEPAVKRHPKASHVNSTPATDGQHVVAFFGSEGLYCNDTEGSLLWKVDFGVLDCGAPGMRHYQWGFASSPILFEDWVLVQCDVQDQSFLAALRLADGTEVWRSLRDEDPTWSSPAVVPVESGFQVVVNGYKHIGGYDLRTGAELWRTSGGGDVPVPTPVSADGLVYLSSAHGRNAPILAIDPLRAKNTFTLDAAEDAICWLDMRQGNYMQTPLVYRGIVYCCKDNGQLSRFDAKSGELLSRTRLGEGNTGFSASGVAVEGKVYFTSEEGEVFVLEAGAGGEVLAQNDLAETCMATPAVSRGELFFRTRSHLVALTAEND